MNVVLTQEDIMRLEIIDLDSNAEDALRFIRGRLLAEIRRQEGMKMRSHLDGGKGSAF